MLAVIVTLQILKFALGFFKPKSSMLSYAYNNWWYNNNDSKNDFSYNKKYNDWKHNCWFIFLQNSMAFFSTYDYFLTVDFRIIAFGTLINHTVLIWIKMNAIPKHYLVTLACIANKRANLHIQKFLISLCFVSIKVKHFIKSAFIK